MEIKRIEEDALMDISRDLCLHIDANDGSVWVDAMAKGESYAEDYMIIVQLPRMRDAGRIRMILESISGDIDAVIGSYRDHGLSMDTQCRVAVLEDKIVSMVDPADMLMVWDPAEYFDGLRCEMIDWVAEHGRDVDGFRDLLESWVDPEMVDVFSPSIDDEAESILDNLL